MPDAFTSTTGRLRVAARAQRRAVQMAQRKMRSAGVGEALPAWMQFVRQQDRDETSDMGDELSRRLEGALQKLDAYDDGKYDRSDNQRELHRIVHSACLPQIYGDSLEQHKARLFREFEIDEINRAVMANWPRRFGKSFAVAQIAAAYVYTQPDTEVLIYSTSKETSQMMLASVRTMLRAIHGDDSCIVGKGSKQRVQVRTPYGYAQPNLCICYPCSEQVSFCFHFRILRAHKQNHRFFYCVYFLII